MFPPRHANSRYLGKARAAHLARLVAAGAIVVVPAACGGGDAEVFGTATTDAAPTAPATSPATTTGPAATIAPATDAPATDAPAASTGAAFPAGGELVVDFTFAAESSDGRVRNPYVAVWVEDGDGNYVATIAVWYEQSDKGTRWIGDLRAWMGASNGEVSSTSTGATRAPGSYSVTWDGTDLDGNLVSQGDYVLFVEAAREHGPYEITSAPLTIGDTGFTVTLDDNGELSDLSATLTA
jgi:hypothetical protein